MQPHQGGQQRGESLVCRETYTKPLLLVLPKENWSRAGVGMGTGQIPSSAWPHPAQALEHGAQPCWGTASLWVWEHGDSGFYPAEKMLCGRGSNPTAWI